MESGANTKEVLTPKNVYRFLTDNLPGLYPHGVIPAAERKGLTLVKFWAQVLDGIIPPEWHASLFGGTQRSRRLSDMMNRTGVQPLPPKLQQEMNALLSGEGGCLPPMWGLGFKYRTKTDFTQEGVMRIQAYFRDKKIPCDVIGLEPGWHTAAYSCSYVWNEKRFPNHRLMLKALNENNYKVNLWEHAYVHPTSPL